MRTVDEIRELCAAATKGPWEWEAHDASMIGLGTKGCTLFEGAVLACERCKNCIASDKPCTWPKQADSDFIAQSRMLVPELLDAHDKLRTAVMYFLAEDWSHVTDAEILREIAQDVAQKDALKWGSLKVELAARDAEIATLKDELEYAIAGLESQVDENIKLIKAGAALLSRRNELDAQIAELTELVQIALELFEDECTPDEEDTFAWMMRAKELPDPPDLS